ncbi:uncharacterized protein LODBEIA_P33470 [Lodderomyces beijingensis]|uniref:Knr4/Smi1-like domain-containing protein n=1 Tax=Lodderomyces beijingensis TaxID=1775926 RepID=A0ABP0ZN73_9ASCO
MKFGQKIQEFIYLLSTDDKYSEYDSRKSFNRVNKPDSQTLLGVYASDNSSSVELDSRRNKESSSEAGIHEMKLAWRHIKHWLHKYAPDINSSLSSKCTSNDLVDFQKDLNIKLPKCVLEFFKITDGQSNFGNSLNMDTTGLIFGLKLMSLDEIMIQTENWRKVSDFVNSELRHSKYEANEMTKLPISHANSSQYKKKIGLGLGANVNASVNANSNVNGNHSDVSSVRSSFDLGGGDSTSRKTSVSSHDSTAQGNRLKRRQKMPAQRTIPPGTIHETFAHPMWIPIVTDEVGNYIGIDLCPASKGVLGQVILFGRDFDFKFQVADTWGDFLLLFANDLETGNWSIKSQQKNNYGDLFVGNEGDLVFVDKESGLEIPYMEMLKRRAVKKWMTSLEKNEDSDLVNGELLNELKENEISILSLSNKQWQSVDTFINKNLDLIDNVKTSERVEAQLSTDLVLSPPSVKTGMKPGSKVVTSGGKSCAKSPLSQEVTVEDESMDN